MNPLLRKLLSAIKENGSGLIKVYDSEGILVTTNDIELVLKQMNGGDEEFTICGIDSELNIIGEFYILPYEEGLDMIVNYTDNDFCNKVYQQVKGE